MNEYYFEIWAEGHDGSWFVKSNVIRNNTAEAALEEAAKFKPQPETTRIIYSVRNFRKV